MLLCPASAIQSINCCQCGRNHRVAVRTHLRHVRVRHRAGARHWRPNPRPRGWLEHTASAAPLPAKGHLAIFTEVHPESTGQLGGGSAGDCSAATAAVSNAEAGRARQNPRASGRERKLELSRRSRQHTLQQSDDSGDVASQVPRESGGGGGGGGGGRRSRSGGDPSAGHRRETNHSNCGQTRGHPFYTPFYQTPGQQRESTRKDKKFIKKRDKKKVVIANTKR